VTPVTVMERISRSRQTVLMSAPIWALLLCGLAHCTAACADPGADFYDVTYTGTFVPDTGGVRMQIDIRQSSGQLRELNLAAPSARYANFVGDGKVTRKGARLIWRVPAAGGALRYEVAVDKRRNGEHFDARMTAEWALLRLDDLVPPARVSARRGAMARANLYLEGPAGWAVETPYGPMRNGPIDFQIADRRFDRPVGWAMAGKLGIRRDLIAGRQVAVAAPSGSKYPRLPTLAFLHWTLPALIDVFPQFPDQLLIVSAFDDMWRGALSGPNSLYLHGDRPMISENSTSPLLHELIHVGTRMSSDTDDWIVEGLAEYYSLEILRRSGGLSQARFEQALRSLAMWVESQSGGLQHPSSGPHTAYAALLFHNLNGELTAAGTSLDAVVNLMLAQRARVKVSRQALERSAQRALGQPSEVLRAAPATQSLR